MESVHVSNMIYETGLYISNLIYVMVKIHIKNNTCNTLGGKSQGVL